MIRSFGVLALGLVMVVASVQASPKDPFAPKHSGHSHGGGRHGGGHGAHLGQPLRATRGGAHAGGLKVIRGHAGKTSHRSRPH